MECVRWRSKWGTRRRARGVRLRSHSCTALIEEGSTSWEDESGCDGSKEEGSRLMVGWFAKVGGRLSDVKRLRGWKGGMTTVESWDTGEEYTEERELRY
jgi:hypothetical protein